MMQSILAVLRIHIMGSMMVLKLNPLNFLLDLDGATGAGCWDHFWDAARKTCPTSLKCQARLGERSTSGIDSPKSLASRVGKSWSRRAFFLEQGNENHISIILVNYTYFGDIYS